jgi:hypothetical protein
VGQICNQHLVVAAIVAAIKMKTHINTSYQGLQVAEGMADFMQKLWCNTQPCNRNFAFDGF